MMSIEILPRKPMFIAALFTAAKGWKQLGIH